MRMADGAADGRAAPADQGHQLAACAVLGAVIEIIIDAERALRRQIDDAGIVRRNQHLAFSGQNRIASGIERLAFAPRDGGRSSLTSIITSPVAKITLAPCISCEGRRSAQQCDRRQRPSRRFDPMQYGRPLSCA